MTDKKDDKKISKKVNQKKSVTAKKVKKVKKSDKIKIEDVVTKKNVKKKESKITHKDIIKSKKEIELKQDKKNESKKLKEKKIIKKELSPKLKKQTAPIEISNSSDENKKMKKVIKKSSEKKIVEKKKIPKKIDERISKLNDGKSKVKVKNIKNEKKEIYKKIEPTPSKANKIDADNVESKKSEYKLFFFISNYSELYPIYNDKLDIQFNNIKELLKKEIENIGAKIITSDYSSLTINPNNKSLINIDNNSNDENEKSHNFNFDDVLGVTYKIYEAIEYYYKLTKKYEFPLKFHCGILLDDTDMEKNPFRKSFIGMKKVENKSINKNSKKRKLNYSNNYLPFTLLSEKTALSVIENYNIFKSDFKSNIWYTDGIKVTESERLNKIYLNRDEEDVIDSFINERGIRNSQNDDTYNENYYANRKKKLFLLSGELGSGKTKIIDEVINNSKNNLTDNVNNNSVVILKITEKKHTEKEYYIIVKIIESLIEVFKDELNIDVNEIIEMINSENIEDINKTNLINTVKRYFDDLYLDKNGVTFYNLSIRLKIAFTDFLKLFFTYIDKPLTIVVDNYQYSNSYCENILLSIFNKKYIDIFDNINMIFIGRDKDMMFNIKNYEKLKYQIYKVYLQNLDKELISNFLQLTFPHKKITKGLVEFIFEITGGNFYTLKEYIQNLIDKDVIFSTNRFLKLKKIDNEEIPENLLEIYESKIDTLDIDTKNILMIISIIGDSFYLVDLENLLHLLNYSGDELLAIDTLLDKGFINKLEDFYYFPEAELRLNIYKKIPKKNRVLIHNLLGEIFENKSMKNFSFKVFYNYYFAENFEKLFQLLDEILSETHLNLNFNALKNIINLAIKELDKNIRFIDDKWIKIEKRRLIQKEKKDNELKKDNNEIEKILNENGEWIDLQVEESVIEIDPTEIEEKEKDDKIIEKYKKLWISIVIYKLQTQKFLERVEPENYKFLEKAILYAKDISDETLLFDLRYKILNLYLSEKKFSKFNEIMEESLKDIIEDITENKKIEADFLVLNTYYQLKKNIISKWEVNLKKAKENYLSLDINPDELEIYNKAAGLFYFKIGDYQNSIRYFNLLLEKVKNRIDFVEFLKILEFTSELSLNLKDYDKIEILYKTIINLCDDFGYFTKKMEYTVKLGVLYSYQNRLLHAINTINPVVNELGKYDNTKNSLALIDVYNKLGVVHQYHGENKPAEEYFNLAIDLSDSISNYDKRSFSFIRKAIFELFNYEYDDAIFSLVEARNNSKKNELTSLNNTLKKIAELGSNNKIFDDLENVILSIDSIKKQLIRTFDRNIVFEIYLVLLRILFDKNHFLKIKTVLEPKMIEMISDVYDFNLVVEFKKISREVVSGSNRKKRKIKADKKVHPVVRKRVNRMKRK